MLLGGGRSALSSVNDENAVERTMRSGKKSTLSSSFSGGGGGVGGIFDENSMQSSKKKGNKGTKSVRMALGPSSSSVGAVGTKTPGQSTSRRRALGDISNRKPGGIGGGGNGGRGSKSGGGGEGSGMGGSVVLKPSRSKSVTFQTPGRKVGGSNALKSGKTPFGSAKKRISGLTPRQGSSRTPSLSNSLAMAPASARKAEFKLPRRQVSFGDDLGGGSARRADPLSTHRRPKTEVREKVAPFAMAPEAEPVEEVEFPAGGRVWHPSDFHDDDLLEENLGFPYKHFLEIKERQREDEARRFEEKIAKHYAEHDAEQEEIDKQLEREIAKDCEEAMRNMEDLVNTLELEEDLTNDPMLSGFDETPMSVYHLDDDISI